MIDFIASADLHIHSRVPENRKGNYFNHCITKFQHLLDITVKKCSRSAVLVVAGDFFDASTVPYKVTNTVIDMLIETNVRLLVVPGQHDLRYHVSGLLNTPLGSLSSCKLVTILNPVEPVEVNGITFIGAGWNEEPATEADVLVMHRMVTKKGELWPGQTNYSTAHAILRKYPWAKCIVSGDNHAPHSLRTKGRLQINCGSMMRSTKSQVDYEPGCWMVKADEWKTKQVLIPCESAEDVFDFDKIVINEMKDEAKKKAEEKIAKFIDTLPKNQTEKPDFTKNLNNAIDNLKPSKQVQDIISEIMEEIVT